MKKSWGQRALKIEFCTVSIQFPLSRSSRSAALWLWSSHGDWRRLQQRPLWYQPALCHSLSPLLHLPLLLLLLLFSYLSFAHTLNLLSSPSPSSHPPSPNAKVVACLLRVRLDTKKKKTLKVKPDICCTPRPPSSRVRLCLIASLWN